jgi:MFS transporter, FHS family, L-fucose permease
MALFFIFGGITSLNDVIIPKLKELFTLNYTEAMLVQFCFFTAYAVIGIPGAALVKRIGYMRGAVVGLLAMAAGCLLFIPASHNAAYPLFLLALFVLASGVVVVQVVTNPLISLLGPAKTTHSRLTFAQAFNSLGTVVFPKVGAVLILGGLAAVSAKELSGTALDAYREQSTRTVVHTYIGLAIAVALVAGVVWMNRNRLKGERHEPTSLRNSSALLGRTRFGWGAACIFLYVGAEVSIGSLIVNYMQLHNVLGVTAREAGDYIPYYWGGALVGRFVGSLLLRLINPGKVLAFNAIGATALIIVSANSGGMVAAWSLLAIGLMNSIMFPTIFSLACEGLGPRAADGSGIINVAIFGGAVVPLATGFIADASHSLTIALALPAVCYLVIAAFGLYARRPAQALAGAATTSISPIPPATSRWCTRPMCWWSARARRGLPPRSPRPVPGCRPRWWSGMAALAATSRRWGWRALPGTATPPPSTARESAASSRTAPVTWAPPCPSRNRSATRSMPRRSNMSPTVWWPRRACGPCCTACSSRPSCRTARSAASSPRARPGVRPSSPAA